MLISTFQKSLIKTSYTSPLKLISYRSLHTFPVLRNEETNNKAINLYQDLISVYSDQSMTPSLKQHIVKGMFLTNEINDLGNDVFRRLNQIIRQDPNLVDEEKLDLISSLNTNHKLFVNESLHHPMEFTNGIEDVSIKDIFNNENFLKRSLTIGAIGVSLFSIITVAAIV